MQEGEKGGSKEEKPPNETAVGELPLLAQLLVLLEVIRVTLSV